MNYLEKYNQWLESSVIDEETKKELKGLKGNEKEIGERFYKDLEFGTGGLRGIMGAGSNRVNKYTIGKATLGFAKYLNDKYDRETLEARGVAIAYDVRNNSKFFAETTARVLSSNNIRVHLFSVPAPTPELSFAVTHYNAVGGIVLTASHNPKEYNGYKVYDEKGCQLIPSVAEELIKYVDAVEDFSSIDFSGNDDLINYVDCTKEFVDVVLTQSVLEDSDAKENLKVVYTPIHGTGNIPVREALKRDGFKQVFVVKEQELPDGNFSTVKSPNPEEKNALNMGIELAKSNDADLVLGTDPDSDRVCIAVKTDDGYTLLTGNQVGALLIDYILQKKDLYDVKKPAIIKTVVTNELGAKIAKRYGVTVFSTLTGFKFIGEKITHFENARISGNEEKEYTFVMGYEESYGYLVGTHARDKDAVVSSLLICEMAAEYKANGKTLYDVLQEIYAEFGLYKDALDSFTLPGKDGVKFIQDTMKYLSLDANSNIFGHIKHFINYNEKNYEEEDYGILPKSNVLKYVFEDDSWIAIRPSGTEPKMKVYYSVRGETVEEAEERIEKYRNIIKGKLGIRGF